MRAAIYARYSSDLQSATSVDDQVRICREKAESESWHVVDVFADHALSGANLSRRAGLLSLMESARSCKFDVVIVEALDRLSRDLEDIAGIYKRLSHEGIAIFSLAEGQVSELHIGLKGTMNALFLKDLANKIRRGQRGAVSRGRSAGGISYGYLVRREITEDGDISVGGRVIDERQAEVVRAIFSRYCKGWAPRRIAAELNAGGVASPRGGLWNASTINGHRGRKNGILHNELYRGVLIYNRIRMVKDPQTGKRLSRPNPESEWVRVPVPSLRIVADDVWEEAQWIKASYGTRPPHKARRPSRLLSGLLSCGECGGAFTIVRPNKYGCSAHRENGSCRNGHQISVNQLEQRVLSGLKRHLVQPSLVTEFVEEFRKELSRLDIESEGQKRGAEAKLQVIETKINRIVAAIADGTDSPALKQALLGLEREKGSIAIQNEPVHKRRLIPTNIEGLFLDKVRGLEAVLNADQETRKEATNVLRGLMSEIVIRPGGGRGKTKVEVRCDPTDLLIWATQPTSPAASRMITVVAEEGFEPPTRGL
jgi:site-specific DNA recombinase